MGNLRNIILKKSYSSDYDEILYDFYIPSLEVSIKYDRLAGFFSSTSLAIAARGIAALIRNDGVMRLIVSPRLSKQDVDTIIQSQSKPEIFIEGKMMKELAHFEDEFTQDHVFALGWMIANKKLEIKVATAYADEGRPLTGDEIQRSGLFHQKVGILVDNMGDCLTFSGSINETATAWVGNIEEFKVFRSWEIAEKEYVQADILKFERFWNNTSSGVKTIDVPEAVEKKLMDIAPNDIGNIDLQKWYTKKRKKTEIKLYKYQEDAIENWIDNKKRGVFEMATGTGKTYTALGCLKKTLNETKKLVAVIVCPYNHLVKQWKGEIRKFDITSDIIIADSSNTKWKNQLADILLDQKNGIVESIILLTTHDTFPSSDFHEILKSSDGKILLIVDEVHGIGAPQRKTGLTDIYEYRLGLSATPKRWFDYEGTDEIFSYFGEIVYRFPLEKAVGKINPQTGKTFLCRYDYKPYFVGLTDDEIDKYERETAKIAQSYHRSKTKEERSKWFLLMLINRQKIIRNASNKLHIFKEILSDLDNIQDCLVYCSPEQIDAVQDILNSYSKQNIIQHKFTSEEDVVSQDKYAGLSEREYLLKNFKKRVYHVLVAIKCLDEGVDIPSVKTAIILASTGNPKEYIQRRGRVLRHSADKDKAVIYDVLVIPNITSSQDSNILELEKRIFKKELIRYKEFSSIAANAVDCFKKLEELEAELDIIS